MRPRLPKPGTHNARLLNALVEAHPGAVWQPSSQLLLMAHSRASDLRGMGWDVEHVYRFHDGRREHGYVLRADRASIEGAA